MAIHRTNARHGSALRPLTGALLSLLACAAWAQALPTPSAQDPAANPTPLTPPGPPPVYWIEPRVFATQRYTDNFLLSTSNRQSEWTTEAGAGIMGMVNTPRLTGSVDYSLTGLYHARGIGDDSHQQALDGQMLLDAWNSVAFIEADASIGLERVSAFAVQPAEGGSEVNTSEARRFRVSPFLRGTWGDAVDYEARVTKQVSRSNASTVSDLDEQGWNLSLGSANDVSRFGWEVAASSTKTDYSLGRSIRFDQATALGRYAVSPTLLVFAQVGREVNDVLTSERTSYSYTSAGIDWRPMETARVAASKSNRYFGSGHNVSLEYRMSRVLFRYLDSRDVTTSQLVSGSDVSNLGGLLNSLYQNVEADPIRRAQLVQAELQRLGLPADLTTIPAYLTSAVALQRTQEFSVTMLTARGVLSFSLQRSRSRQLDSALNVGGDFDLSNQIDEKGWSVAYAHRLTPRLSLNTIFQQLDTDGLSASLSSRLRSLTVGLNARLAPRTIGSVSVRRSSYQATSPYRELAVRAVLVHRF
ncbi:MAG: TIGR03016 family PEP-CTERM system-associated outer membrane protein [Hydrogenophaga sp.]|uniref:TIGR03016 family PEP-CTERM system-associated outer membrane protein n=1 Tax=Hydrogenophaga sp. TaxID=1904254 RepID=UPI001DB6E6B5|nr:TIGR03016 family PEP-CTERM system-associated outer membrane protein [Hydrogenophaga sp.]MBX3610162.1 TIGR03016 family PEP-CTERM system-associated outer membrane protein [Hydrogenophaga sp.]